MLINGDCTVVLKQLEKASVDMIFADPPYFLSNGGVSIHNGNIVSVNKGNWDKKEMYSDITKFTHEWLSECYRVLKSSGTIWVSGTHHNIFVVAAEMEKIGFHIINMIVWHKSDPPQLIFKNKFRFSHELILWAKKDKNHFFNYDLMYEIGSSEMEDVWTLPAVQKKEKTHGYHPTQKPECLLERIILSSTKEDGVVLDPFMGSGTTCFVARKMNRKYIGIEKEVEYFELSKRRIESLSPEKE